MPEYLAPGVYVEEVPSANKPIAAASTSTSAMVGMTERGPVGRPVLVTSAGDYARKFGGKLNPLAYGNGLDALPYAADGFFTNGGSRLYVVRVTGAAASESELRLTAATGTPADAMVLLAPAAAGQAEVLLSNSDGLAAGDTFLIQNGNDSAFVTVDAAALAPRVTINGGLTTDAADNAVVREMTPGNEAEVSAVDATNSAILTVSANETGYTAGTGVRLTNDAGDVAFVRVASRAGSDVTMEAPFDGSDWVGATIETLTEAATTTALDGAVAASGLPVHLAVDSTAGIAAEDVLRIGDAATGEFVTVSELSNVVTLTANLADNQPAGVVVTPAAQIATVHAASQGVWGRQLRVRSAANALVETTTQDGVIAPAGTNQLTLTSAFGLYDGSVIMIGGTTRAEVASVDTSTGIVTLTANLAAEVAAGTPVASQEFALIVERLGSDGKVAESELFENLSLCSEHPRYAPNIIGSWDTGSDTPSRTGRSSLIRLSDQADGNTRVLPLTHGVTRHLTGGDDDVGGISDASFIGTASSNAEERTGIEALRNVATISLVAVPGRTNVNVHKALIAHCEAMRYRFAVLETPLGSNFDACQTYRQNFDNTRAAIYYPGLTIADPFGPDGATRDITPSGHMMGLYARVDNTRGVHKAPANEVVRGALSFESKLSKGEQDILNPKNLNCFRDFRDEGRGLRVYGARVATSDPEWRYINVRRLLLMIEQSLDTGLQWAVFEPNEKPLWDGVKQSVTGFLNTIWRSGALEGQTQEEAFFVNIGYGVTMTQDDINNGRMIVEIGVAPVKPAEFVIARISQKTREATG